MNLGQVINLFRNMGFRYAKYRLVYEIKKKGGLIQMQFPLDPPKKYFLSLTDWKSNTPHFLIEQREYFTLGKKQNEKLREEAHRILAGKVKFFDVSWINLGNDYDWITHPETSHRYNSVHWSKIPDYDYEIGDIKYVWEKSRFTYLQTIIRYDYHFEEDNSAWVFDQMDSWIEHNPVNCGPNWRCSQEMSLRLLNWCYVLYFYKDSKHLTEERWGEYQNIIYWILHHVYHHINFSRIAVRNNHAITETGMLFLSGLLFPFIPETKVWSEKGRKWLEQEIRYQIYEDGTFLQFSMNYHRVVIQLLTVFIQMDKLHNKALSKNVLEKAYRSLKFLGICQDQKTGWLPNYGANDGALFFKWTDFDYRDYRPQLNSLHLLLTGEHLYNDIEGSHEDACWLGILDATPKNAYAKMELSNGVISFDVGGYYLIRDGDTLTMLRCGKHKDRPSQADNLHLDIWVDGVNILRDSGSYKYNTDQILINYFMGSAGHNTVMIDGHDQMLKGSRFIWFNWSQAIGVEVDEDDDCYIIKGRISAFQHLKKGIIHQRLVKKYKGLDKWEIEDQLHNVPDSLSADQLWHSGVFDRLAIKTDQNTERKTTKGWYSSYYGLKEEVKDLHIRFSKSVSTTIEYNR